MGALNQAGLKVTQAGGVGGHQAEGQELTCHLIPCLSANRIMAGVGHPGNRSYHVTAEQIL